MILAACDLPVLERHELPAWEPGVGLIKSSDPGQNTPDTIWTDDFHLDISSSLMFDPDPDSDVLECLEVRVLQHFFSDLERASNTLRRDRSAGWFDDRGRICLHSVVAIALRFVASLLLLVALRLSTLGYTRNLTARYGDCIGVIGEPNGGRVEPCLWLDQLPFAGHFDDTVGVNPTITI